MASTKRLRKEAVGAAWAQLEQSSVHTHFLGYLAVREAARIEGRTNDLEVGFKSFFDRFLRPQGMVPAVPYIKPFGGPTNNRNVAGSYALSSLRDVAPLTKVVSVRKTGQVTLFSLEKDHSKLALEALLKGKRISSMALSVFLYRDYEISETYASPEGLLEIFRHDFSVNRFEDLSMFSAPFDYEGAYF